MITQEDKYGKPRDAEDATVGSETKSTGLFHLMAHKYLQGYHKMILVCVIVGVATAFATYLLDLILRFISSSLTSGLSADHANYPLIIYPAIGLLITVAYTKWIVRIPLSHGTQRIRNYLKEKDYVLPPRLMWSSVIGSSVTLGFGGSAGAEGPSAFTGSAIASNLSRLFKLDEQQMRLMIGIGAGAGIAGIFRAPLGGVLFTLEVLAMPMQTLPVLALVVACLIAGLGNYLLAGQHFDVNFFNSVRPHAGEVGFIIFFGVLCGLYSLYYTFVFHATGNRLQNILNPWHKAILAGLMIGVAIFIFPPLYATGYDSLDKLLAGNSDGILGFSFFDGAKPTPLLLASVAFGIILIKAFVCSATNNGGGVAGNFAPTLFAGGFFGFAFAILANTYLGVSLHVPNYIFLGMAGAMSGIIQAPLLAIFLTSEMADRADFLWALTLVAFFSWTVRRLLGRRLPGI